MKSRIATYLIALSMFIAGTAFANNPVKQKNDTSQEVATLLKKELKYPKFAKENNFQCCVLVRLIINNDGTFKVDCINCTNEAMKEYVTKAIENINKEELRKYAGQEFSFKLNFKLI